MSDSSIGSAVGRLAIGGGRLTTRIRLKGGGGARDLAAAMLSTGAAHESPSGSVVTSVGPALIDHTGHIWTITLAGRIAVNGVTDATTANVVELAYVGGVMWQLNAAGNWYWKTLPEPWKGPTRVSPLPLIRPAAVLIGTGRGVDSGGASLATGIVLTGRAFSAAFSVEFA